MKMITNLPTIPLDEYPPARRVAFEASVPTDDWEDPPLVVTEFSLQGDFPLEIIATRPYLTALKVTDHQFAIQLVQDEVLHGTYTAVRRARSRRALTKQRQRNPWLHSSILTIERALRNRMEFVKNQKIHVLDQAAFIACELEKERVNREADDQIKIVCSLLKDWKSETLVEAIQDFEQTVENLMR